jgi:hypothetical protein
MAADITINIYEQIYTTQSMLSTKNIFVRTFWCMPDISFISFISFYLPD